jgi:cobalamin-dependent methionine synthase I
MNGMGPRRAELYGHAQSLLKRIVNEKLLQLRGVYGFWKANTFGEDIVFRSRLCDPGARAFSTCSANRKRLATESRIDRLPTSSRLAIAASSIISARLRHCAASARTNS